MEIYSAFRKPLRKDIKLPLIPPSNRVVLKTGPGLKDVYKNIQSPSTIKEHNGNSVEMPEVCDHHKLGYIFGRRYKVQGKIGEGQTSVILSAQDSYNGNHEACLKIVHSSKSPFAYEESDLLWRINSADHQNKIPVIKLQSIFQFGPYFCMVFPVYHPAPITEHFTSLNLIGPNALSSIAVVAKNILQVLEFLSLLHTIHADLKPSNLLLKKAGDFSSVTVVDLGNAIRSTPEGMDAYLDDFDVQPFAYRAPEVLLGVHLGSEIDVWSLACVLVELYLGRPLFNVHNRCQLITQMFALLGPIPSIYCKGKFSVDYLHLFGDHWSEEVIAESLGNLLLGCETRFINFVTKLFSFDYGKRLKGEDWQRSEFILHNIS